MSAIPEGPHPYRYDDIAFKKWLLARGETRMATQLRAHVQYYFRPAALMLRLGITTERQDYYRKLRQEFSEPREKAARAWVESKKTREAHAVSKAEPAEAVKQRVFPKRHVPKGFA